MWGEGAFEELRRLLPPDARRRPPGPAGRLARRDRRRSRSPCRRSRRVPTRSPRTSSPPSAPAPASWRRARWRSRPTWTAGAAGSASASRTWPFLRPSWRSCAPTSSGRGGDRAPQRPADVLNVAFLVNDLQLSGGVGVVVEHARQLAPPRDRRHAGAGPRAGGPRLALPRPRRGRRAVARPGPHPPLRRALRTWWETTSGCSTSTRPAEARSCSRSRTASTAATSRSGWAPRWPRTCRCT